MVRMLTLIGAALLLALASHIYHTARRFFSPQPTGNPVLDRLDRDLVAERDTAAEAREIALARQLLARDIGPAAYQQQMNELAHACQIRQGERA
jgi:hypothetical protein